MPGLRRSRARIAPQRISKTMLTLQQFCLFLSLVLGCYFLALESSSSLSLMREQEEAMSHSRLGWTLNASLQRSISSSGDGSIRYDNHNNPSRDGDLTRHPPQQQQGDPSNRQALQKDSSSYQVQSASLGQQQPSSALSSASSSSTTTFVIAAAPRNERYAVALWSQLECLADPHKYDSIVVAAPTWAHALVESILQHARQRIPHFRDLDNGVVSSQTKQLTSVLAHNDRYDVGLWCDALQTIRTVRAPQPKDVYVLSNDSIFALRPFTGVLDALRANSDLTLTSLNYSNRGGKYWVESVLRGFSDQGLQRFMDHSCVPKTHKFYCPRLKARKHIKRCIVENFEIAIAGLFEPHQVKGLYPSDTQSEGIRGRKTWVAHPGYWRKVLREQHNFPAAKTKNPNMIPNVWTSPDLKSCTRYLDPKLVKEELEYPKDEGALEDMQQRRMRDKLFQLHAETEQNSAASWQKDQPPKNEIDDAGEEQ